MEDSFSNEKALKKPEGSYMSRPKTAADKDPIDVMLEKKKKFEADLKPKSKPDHNLISGLQSQITKSNSKITEINHRCNTLEQRLKAVLLSLSPNFSPMKNSEI
jgi:TolA-binding protein